MTASHPKDLFDLKIYVYVHNVKESLGFNLAVLMQTKYLEGRKLGLDMIPSSSTVLCI